MPSFGINQWLSQIKTNKLTKEQIRLAQSEQADDMWCHQQVMEQLRYQSKQLYVIATILERTAGR